MRRDASGRIFRKPRFAAFHRAMPWLAILGVHYGALAQTPPAGNPVSSTTAAGPASPADPASPKSAYVDRVIDGALPADDGMELKATNYDSSGWARSWRVDYSIFYQKGAPDTRAQALGINAYVDTPNYGSISVNGNLVSQRTSGAGNQTDAQASTFRIDQRGVPLDGGWRADYRAGDIGTGIAPLGRGIGRIFLPSNQVRGAGGQWYLGDAMDVNAAVGEAGLFNGLNVTGFQTSGGQISSAGAQARLPFSAANGRSDVAFQVLNGQNISDGAGLGSAQNTRAAWASAAWEGAAPWAGGSVAPGFAPISERPGGLRLQGSLMHSSSSRQGEGVGAWVDAAWRTERWRNTASLFRLEPNLRWGMSELPRALPGIYLQSDTSTRQWQVGFSGELSDSVRKAPTPGSVSAKSAFFNANGRYRIDTRNSVTAGVNLRALSGSGQALTIGYDRLTDFGQSQWRGDFASAGGVRTRRAGLDQGWAVTPPATLSTSLALERVDGPFTSNTGVIWGILGAVQPWSRVSLDASLRGARRSDGSDSLNANLGMVYQSWDGWSIAMRYTEARGQEPLQPLVVSALAAAMQPVVTTLPVNRALQVVLRYEGRAGTAVAPLAGLPGGGAGVVNGTVFFDADANGRRDAAEGGVPGVTVILDRRYVARTDAQGRYEFPAVAAGEHSLEISADNVPLPWSPAQREAGRLSVRVRSDTVRDFPVQRDR